VVGGLVALLAISAFGQSVTSVYFPSNCRNERFKPRTIVVTCADANFQIRQLRWQRWATSSAAGHGSARINDCQPNCDPGRFRSYRQVVVRLTHPITCRATGVRQFTRLHYTFTRRRPPDIPITGVQLYRCVTQGGR